jgi:hypothetical protein
MIVRQMPANGVPWLFWIGDTSWECQACGQAGHQPPFENVAAFARWLGDVKRAHAACGSYDEIRIGDPLNFGRKEA